MKYENFVGSVSELILMKIKEIEEKEHIKVLHANGLKKSCHIIRCLLHRCRMIEIRIGNLWKMSLENWSKNTAKCNY
jgi:hypothetical protein